jgi:predicted flavoprotein YhiN
VQPSGGQQFSTNAAAIAIADVLLRELTDDTIRMTLDTAVENVAQAVVGAA